MRTWAAVCVVLIGLVTLLASDSREMTIVGAVVVVMGISIRFMTREDFLDSLGDD